MDYTPTREAADKVAAAILRSGRSKASVAQAAGIPHTTFTRKINGDTEFTFGELLRIAEVLEIAPSNLTPSAFMAVA
ncbi:helix-turn-helix domain-containing protein [Agromyces sp. NBRC 114283]|uniref:helix-turn-helix domain-containing protein n=1 Tax=Agromyces sp. NBRC 114283 TaxID=2994521 RepID=UPI0024A59F69|nr:helix-turn-helix domain-containing protein [Agromyces sp. NBRC 114283]GLU91303.1 hypothetical protein Agsp01_35580 [Agromyces sp. NBRC 114283]